MGDNRQLCLLLNASDFLLGEPGPCILVCQSLLLAKVDGWQRNVFAVH